MVYNIASSQIWLSAIMVIIVAASTALNFYLAKRSNDNFKRNEMSKKADKTYVDDEIIRVEKETDLKIKLIEQSHEEVRSLLEDIQEKVTFVYKRHWAD